MAISHAADATASTVSAEPKTLPVPHTATATGESFIPPEAKDAGREHVRHLLFGSTIAIQTTIRRLHKLGYAEPNDWSRPIATGRAGEMMSILTKRVDTGG